MVSQDLGMPSAKLFVPERKKLQFDSLWEECVQEEARVAKREALLLRDEDQALTTHTKGGRKRYYLQKETRKESHPPKIFIHKKYHRPRRFHKFQKGQRGEKDFSSYQCYHHETMGHIANNFPAI